MANALYDPIRVDFARGLIDWEDTGMEVEAILVDTGAYNFNASHKHLDQITAPARVGDPMPVEDRVVFDTGGLDASDVTFPAVTGPSIEAIVLYIKGTTDADSRLIAFIDNAQGLPTTPNTGDIRVIWSNEAARIFRL